MSRKKIAPKTDSERETRVLLEEVRSQFNIVAEQYGNIDRKLDLQEVTLSKVEMEVQIVKSRVGSIDAKVNSVERELGAVKEAVLDNSRRLDRLGQKVENVTENHEVRLKAIEAKI